MAEDHGGEARLEEIKKKFGKRVARIVRECSDSLTADPAKKEKWSKRKKRYVKHLRHHAHDDALLVSCADKLYNARGDLGRRAGDRPEGLEAVSRWPEEAGTELPRVVDGLLQAHAQGSGRGTRT